MDLFANVKKRCLLLVVKSFLGRFFKDIHYSQLDEPEIHARAIGMSFRLCNLELNEELFNSQLMRETPFRLVSGTINEIKGTLSLGAVDGRSLEFEGIDLVVQLLAPAERAPPMAPTRPPGAAAPTGVGDSSVLRRPDGSVMDEHEALYTSLITGDVTRQLVSEDILDAGAMGGGAPGRGAYVEGNGPAAIDGLSVADIDEGLDALATTIKGVIHSLKGKVRHVTVRLRVPPTDVNGSDSSSDVPLDASADSVDTPTASPLASLAASATVRQEKLCASELLIHMKGDIELLDETQPNSFGNSFRKRVRFAGLRVAVYDAYEVETTADEEVQRIRLEDTILSGDLDAMENEISVQFVDVDRRVVGAQATWKIKVAVKQAHALLSPNQLARMSMIVSALCTAAPEAPNDGAAAVGAEDDAANPHSKLTIQLGAVSCSVLVSEQPEAMRAAWGSFPAAPFCDSLKVPHYGIRTGGAQLQVRSGAMPTSQSTDQLHELFRRYGNRYVSLWLDFVEVVERRPSFDPTIIFRIFNNVAETDAAAANGPNDDTTTAHVQAPAPLRLLLRSTSAIHADDVDAAIGKSLVQFAKRKGVIPNHRRSIIRQDVFVSIGDVAVDADVETIDRLLEFYNIVDAHLFRVSHPTTLLPPLDDNGAQSPRNGGSGSQPSSSAPNGGSSNGASPFGDDAEFFGTLGSMQRMDEGMLSDDQRPPRRNRQPSSSQQRRQSGLHLPPVVLSSARFEVDSGCVRMAFPVDRTPNIDVYGPLTQRLFAELTKQAQTTAPTFASDDAFAPPPTDGHRPSDLLFLSKVLQMDVVDLQVGLPAHSPHLVLCNLRSAACALIDSFEGSRTELVTAEFETMDGDVTHAPEALLDSDTCIAVTRQNSKGPSMLLRCEDGPKQGFAAAIQHAWSRLTHFGPSEPLHHFLEAEGTLLQQSPIACALRIQHVEVSLHQDELLLLLFLVDQIVECLVMAMETHAALLSHVKEEHSHRMTHEEQLQQQHPDGGPRSSVTRPPPRVASSDSSTFATPLTSKSSRFTDPPASVIREQLLKSSKLMTSAYNPRQSVRSGWDAKKSAMFFSMESEVASLASSGTLWGSHRSRRREEEGSPVAVHVHIGSGWLTLYAPRLLPSGLPIGEPLHMLLPLSERYNETDLGNPKWLYHTYSIEARNAVIAVTSNTVDAVTSVQMNLRLERVEVAEKLCPIPPGVTLPPSFGCQPPWGGVQLLLQGYGDLYNRSHQIVDPEPRQTLLLYLNKDRNVEKMTQTTLVDMSIDRCCLHHQAAHEGDHWLFVVMNFIADNPTAASADDNDDGDDASASAVPCPLSFTTNVAVKSCDFLVQYRPLGRDSMLLVLVPFLKITVGPLTADPKVVVAIRFDRISILVHNHFADDLLVTETGTAKGGFGATRRGVSRDLEALGFVQVLCAGTIDSASDNIVVRIKDVPDKPVNVHVAHVKVELSCAYDACYYFQLIQSHFGAGGDMPFIPKPFCFASAFSSRYALHHDAAANSHAKKNGEPLVRVLVDNLSSRIEELIRTKLTAPAVPPLSGADGLATRTSAPQTQHTAPPPRATTLPRGYSDDLDQDGIDSPVRITESQLDDFVDAGAEFEAVRRGEVEAQRVPLWDVVADTTRIARLHSGGPQSDDERDDGQQSHTPAATTTPSIRDAGIPSQRVAKHFSQFRASSQGQRHADPLMCPRTLAQCPPIAVEVLVTDCHADVKLYGGSDFGLGFFSVHSDDGYSETMAFFQTGDGASADVAQDDDNRNQPRAAPFELSLASHPPGRRVNECISLALRYIFVQVDLFEPGHDQTMHLLTFVRDVEIRDLIDGSPVQTIMMCSIPRELRDHDGWAFEMKWVTRTPLGSRGGVGRPEEDLSFRLQPMVITIHRRVIDLLMLFVETPNIEAPPSTMFFRRFVVHPLRLRLNVLFEVQNYQALLEGQPMELASLFPSVQDSRVWLPMINLESFPVSDFAVMLADALQSQVSMDAVLMLLCGVQPIRTVAEASSATAGLVLMPLDHYKRSKNLYRGILKGLSNFSTRIGAEALNVAGGATRTAHETIHMATATVRQQEILSRGNQPASVAEGFLRGAGEVADGFRGVRDIVRYCISDDGSIAQLPLAALAPVNGVMRALTQIFTGTRNTFRPDAQMLDRKIFKN